MRNSRETFSLFYKIIKSVIIWLTMSMKEFLIRKMMAKQLAAIPKEQQDMIIKLVTENPAFFQQIAKEVQDKVAAGKDQQAAMMEVMRAHEEEIKKLLGA